MPTSASMDSSINDRLLSLLLRDDMMILSVLMSWKVEINRVKGEDEMYGT